MTALRDRLAELTGHEVVAELRSAYADQARARARVLAAVWEVALCGFGGADSTERMTEPDEWSCDEVRAALAVTRAAARRDLELARGVCSRLPELHAAMAEGELDEARARVFSEWTDQLTPEHAHAVCAELLPTCRLSAQTRKTTGQLKDDIKTHAIALDPDWARRRYEAAVRGRKIVGVRNNDGTANLEGRDLPAHRVAAACRRIDAIAKSAKRSGDGRPIDHLRTELYLGMTDGTYESLSDAQILARLSTTRFEGVDDTEPVGTDAASTAQPGAAQPSAEPAPAPSDQSQAETRPMPSRDGVEVRARVTTLLGMDRLPAALAGWGPIHAEYARTLVADLGEAQWRYVVVDDEGAFTISGLTNVRPTGSEPRRRRTKATVEILIPIGLLRTFAAHVCPPSADPLAYQAWRTVVLDIARRVFAPQDPSKNAAPEDVHRRYPRRGLRRDVIAAIHHCVGVGCRAPSSRVDLDHLLDHAKGGLTTGRNLDPLCQHDHQVKHKAGWTVQRVDAAFFWRTRQGHHYIVEIDPVLADLPRPMPSPPPEPIDPGERDSLGRRWEYSDTWEEPLPPLPPYLPYVPPPRTDPADDPPPF